LPAYSPRNRVRIIVGKIVRPVILLAAKSLSGSTTMLPVTTLAERGDSDILPHVAARVAALTHLSSQGEIGRCPF
jgi:hypothetical protein